MSLPTHPSLQVRNIDDALIVLEGVRLGYLPLITRRLTCTECDALIQDGAVFVWEEHDYVSGVYSGSLQRWTDRRKWSASVTRPPFIIYREKSAPAEGNKKSSKSGARKRDVPNKPNGLTKQTFTALLSKFDSHQGWHPIKWHLTCYFRSQSLHALPTVDSDPLLRDVTPIPGVFIAPSLRKGSASPTLVNWNGSQHDGEATSATVRALSSRAGVRAKED